ncbi:MAG: 50S ribosomal protein L11 methyltransferase [Chloroflexi bacterium]|nr:50S ribosomal protein L11 methyltransferase [Chloroflexota bacterium]
MSRRQRAFIRHWTRVSTPPLVPEVRLYLADALMPLWQTLARDSSDPELPPPYWAFAWGGGQAVARYVLDHPGEVRGARVLDLATGSGLCAIAALQAGATDALGTDIDPWCAHAVSLNATLNAVRVPYINGDLLDGELPDVDVILAGDIGYEWNLATRGATWLRGAADAGIRVLIGDPERHHLPPDGLEIVATFEVPTTLDLEQSPIKHTTVFRMQPG